MKIVYLNSIGALGGAERVLLALLAEIRCHFLNTDLTLIAGTDGPLLERAHGLGVKTIPLTMKQEIASLGDSERRLTPDGVVNWVARSLAALPSSLAYASELRRLLRRLGPDLIHSNGLKMHLLAGLARPVGVPIIWHLHDFYGLRPIVPPLIKGARHGLRGAIAVSKAVAQDARRLLPGLPLKVIYNTIDTECFRPGCGNGPALDRLAGLPPAPEGVVRVGLVATYAFWKGHEVFLEAVAQLIRDPTMCAARFFIVGGPIYSTPAQYTEEILRRRARELGVGHCMCFVPFQQNLSEVYQSLDVVVHASTQPEPFGLTVAEAMACGRAVVVSRAGGAAELFTPGYDAFAAPPGNAGALASAMRQLAADKAERYRLGTNARATAVRLFHLARLGPQVASFYARVLRQPLAPGLANEGIVDAIQHVLPTT